MFTYFQEQWPSGQIVACGYDGVPVGFISTSAADRSTARIMMFAVDPSFRSHGVGSSLLTALRQRAAIRGMRSITLEVRTGNAATISFYSKRGFTPCGVLERFYRDGGDALSMSSPVQLNI
jgi:ribosomal-protein-alanine N-acetyltransferase